MTVVNEPTQEQLQRLLKQSSLLSEAEKESFLQQMEHWMPEQKARLWWLLLREQRLHRLYPPESTDKRRTP